jgi:hypothetical protein
MQFGMITASTTNANNVPRFCERIPTGRRTGLGKDDESRRKVLL